MLFVTSEKYFLSSLRLLKSLKLLSAILVMKTTTGGVVLLDMPTRERDIPENTPLRRHGRGSVGLVLCGASYVTVLGSRAVVVMMSSACFEFFAHIKLTPLVHN